MGKKRQRKEAIAAGGLDPEDVAALAEEDEFAKELAAAREIEREQQLLRGDEGSEDEDAEEDGVDGNGKAKPREFINNQVIRRSINRQQSGGVLDGCLTTAIPPNPIRKRGLRQALEEIQAANGARPWPETMDVCAFPLELADVHDDIQREVRAWCRIVFHPDRLFKHSLPIRINHQTAFYEVALASVKEGRKRLLAHGVPYQRPDDFFCDMLKSDEHMAKVRCGPALCVSVDSI